MKKVLFLFVSALRAATLDVGTGQTYSTIQAGWNAAVAGDTVVVHLSGSPYTGAHIIGAGGGGAHVSGTAGNPITLHCEAGATINAPDGTTNIGLSTDSLDYMVIDGCTVTATGTNSIKITNCSTGCQITNNDTTGTTASCILTGYAYGVLIQGNKTHSCGSVNSQHGMYVSNSARGADVPIVRGNESYSNFGAALQLNGGCDNPAGDDHVINGGLIEGNKFHDGPGMSIINSYAVIIRNNQTWNITGAGDVKLANDSGCAYGARNNVIAYNTFTGTSACIRITQESTAKIYQTGNIIFGNICVTGTFDCVVDVSGLDPANCGDGTDQGVNYFVAGLKRTSSQVTSGVFVDWTNHDLHLVSGSPAINIGSTSPFHGNSAPPIDYDTNARNVGNPDVGAFEFGSSAAAADTGAPTAPGTPSGTVTPYQAAFSWSASTDDREVLYYTVFRDGTALAIATVASYTDTTVAAGTAYTYTVKATDGVGNLSSASSGYSVTIPGITGCLNADTAWRYRLLPTLDGTAHEIKVDVTPFVTTANDGVFGMSLAVPGAYADLGTIVRFNNSGNIDARNGAAYTADATVAFSLGTVYHLRIPFNVTAHTYSVYVTPGTGSETLLAANYAFRSEQATAAALNYASVNDDAGSIAACSIAIDGMALDTMTFLTLTNALTGATRTVAVFSH